MIPTSCPDVGTPPSQFSGSDQETSLFPGSNLSSTVDFARNSAPALTAPRLVAMAITQARLEFLRRILIEASPSIPRGLRQRNEADRARWNSSQARRRQSPDRSPG